jgi:hypothetical protein
MKREPEDAEEREGFRSDFSLALETLRLNDRAQINALTDLVAQNLSHAATAVECIRQRIRTVCSAGDVAVKRDFPFSFLLRCGGVLGSQLWRGGPFFYDGLSSICLVGTCGARE